MTLFFDEPTVIGGKGKWNNNPFRFYDNGEPWILGSGKISPDYKDVVLRGIGSITLLNAKKNSLNYVKLFGATEQRDILPSEYQRVEYIESSGTQYINTGIPVSNDLTFGYKVSPKLANQLSISQLRPSPAGHSGLIVWQSGGNINIRYISDGSQFTKDTSVKYALGQVFDIIFNDNNNFYIDGSLIYTKTNTIDTSGVLVTGLTDVVYSLWAKIDGVLVFNGIPCRRNSDSVLGMYDTVSGNFLTNAGTGDFTAGADVTAPSPDTPMDIWCNNGVLKVRNKSGLPLGYQRVEYLKNNVTWRQTRILTPFTYNQVTRIVANIEIVTDSGNKSNMFVASTTNGSVSAPYITLSGMVSGLSIVNFNYTNNVVDVSFTSTSSNPLVIGGWSDTAWTGVYNYGNIKLYNGTTLLADYIPCRRKSDSILGMYDTVTGTFLINAGTGDFVAGNPVSDPIAIYADGTTETVEITGKNLFDGTWEQGAISYKSDQTYEACKVASTIRIRVVNEIFLDHTKTYTISVNNPDLEFCIQAFNEQHRLYTILGITNVWATKPLTFTGAYRIAIALRYKTQTDILPTEGQNAKVQLEQGSIATEYEPYFNGGSADAEMLLAVGSYKDTQEVLTGSVTRNIGIKVLDGTETWNYVYGSTPRFLTYINAINDLGLRLTPLYSTHFLCVSDGRPLAQVPDNTIYTGGGTGGEIYIQTRNFGTTVATLKQWLANQYNAGQPVIIVYPTSSPTTETVTAQPLSIQAGTNIITAEGSIDNLELEVKYKSGVNVTITEIDNVNLDNNVVVTVD